MTHLPLDGVSARAPIDPDRWRAGVQVGSLLTALGASVEPLVGPAGPIGPAGPAGSVSLDGYILTAAPTTVEQDWADSGIAALTGRPDGPLLRPSGHPATTARAAGLALELLTRARLTIDGAPALSQRAAHLDLRRRGDQSANASARLIAATDGWFALNLARPSDLELVPALVEGNVGEPWAAINEWAAHRSVSEIEERAILLGLAVGISRNRPAPNPWRLTRVGRTTPPRIRPLVVNLGSLWAAPLCAYLLGQAGAEVVHIESPARPDGARLGTPGFYRELHAGHRLETIDVATAAGRDQLLRIVRQADVLITASRESAVRRMGLTTDSGPNSGPRVWVAITGHGDNTDRVGFGDDAAVAGGLVAWDESGPVFVGDAIADPLTGLLATVAATACLRAGGKWRVELNLSDVAAYANHV